MLTFIVILVLIKLGLDQRKENKEPIMEDFETQFHENTPL